MTRTYRDIPAGCSHDPRRANAWLTVVVAVAVLIALLAAPAAVASAQDQTVELETRIRYVAGDSIYLDHGSEAGLAADLVGTVSRDGRELATLRIVEVTSSTAAATIADRMIEDEESAPRIDDVVTFRVTRPGGGEPEPEPVTLKEPEPVPDGPAPGDPDFVPLLARPVKAKPNRSGWIADGHVRAAAIWTEDWTDSIEFITLRASSRATLDRMFDAPIALQWDLTFDFREGAGNKGAEDYGKLEYHINELFFTWAPDPQVGIYLGRLQPRALPALGRYDGVAFEYGSADGLRVGVASGFRPELLDLEPSGRNLIAMAYGAGKITDGDLRLSTSLGVLATWYRSAPDRHALFADLRIHLGKVWFLTASSEFDLYGNSEAVRSGLGLTRLNATTRLMLGVLSFRVGWHQNQLRDTLAQRAIVTDTSLYNDGTRRLVAAVSQHFDGWRIDEEFTWWSGTGTGSDYQFAIRGRTPHIDRVIGFSLGGYWRDGSETDRYGGDFGVFWTPDATWSISFRLDAAVIRPEGSRGTFDFPEGTGEIDISWIISRDLISSLSLSISGSEEVMTSTLSLSVTVRFRTSE